jgi:hypothetical protein
MTPPPPPRSDRARDTAALLLVGGVGAALLIGEALRRWNSARLIAGPFDPADLATLSPLDHFESLLFGALALLRLAAAKLWKRRLLLPLLDLPLLGLVVTVSGGTLSPLDPTLALVYLSALLFLRGSEAGRATPRRLAAELLIGLVALHALVLRHDDARLASGTCAETARVAASIDGARRDTGEALRTIGVELAELPPGDAVAKSSRDADAGDEPPRLYAALTGALRLAQEAFGRFLAQLAATTPSDTLGDAKQELETALDRDYNDFFEARARWRPAPLATTATNAVESLDRLRESQWNVRQDLLARMDEIEQSLARRDRMEARRGAFLRDATLRRIAMAGALLLFAIVAIALRDRLAAAVREAEERRARRDLEASQQEKEHWIAVTAGLTHGLGNDILAYDVWLREIEGALGDVAAVPERVTRRLRFLVDSNRGRLGFLQFLDAFARQRQSAAGDAPPPPSEPLELVPLLERVRRNLAQVEIADLPPEGSDAGVDRQIRKLRDLPLAIRCDDPAAGRLARGQRGLVEFVVYELLKNALRSATGALPLTAVLHRSARGVELALDNDVQVDEANGVCPRCGASGRLRKVRRRRDAAPACDACFGAALQFLLDESFAPGKGSGTGLGLFLIRYFLATFWNGDVRARVVDAATPTVRFTVDLPDGDSPPPVKVP